MYRVWKKLSCCKYALKTLSKARYNSIDKRVEEARDNLAEHQGNHEVQDNQSFYIEKVLREELEKWSLIQEKVFKQKSRDQWVQAGDGNNSYLFALMKAKSANNSISLLVDDQGNHLTKNIDILAEVVRFYKNLIVNNTIFASSGY